MVGTAVLLGLVGPTSVMLMCADEGDAGSGLFVAFLLGAFGYQWLANHFAIAVNGCVQDVPADCTCPMDVMHTHGGPRGVGDELCLWLEGVRFEGSDRAPVVRRYTFAVQCLRTGYPTIGAEQNPADDIKIDPDRIAAVMPFYDSIAEGMLRGLREVSATFQTRATAIAMTAQGPRGSQAGWKLTFSCLNPKVPA